MPNSKVATMRDAVAELVRDGDTVAIEGFTHLICFAAGHEIIRQGRRELTLARLTPDLIYDQLIGAGCARRLIFSWLGNPGVGSLHAVRRWTEGPKPRLELVHLLRRATRRAAARSSACCRRRLPDPIRLSYGLLPGERGRPYYTARRLYCPRRRTARRDLVHSRRRDRHSDPDWHIGSVLRRSGGCYPV
jgi:hypothetical protein